MHRLLKRQLKKVGFVGQSTPMSVEQIDKLLNLIDASYCDTDADRKLLEHSLDVSSAEMKELYQELEVRSAHKLKRMEHKYQRLKDNLKAHYFFYTYGTDQVFTYVSDSVRNILGYSPAEFLMHCDTYLTRNPLNEQAAYNIKESIKGNPQAPYEIEMLHKEGYTITLEVVEVPIRNGDGKVVEIEGLARDITLTKRAKTELLNQKEQMEFIAHHDVLTGLPNRLNLYNYLQRLIHDAIRSSERFAVIFIDLDYFKHINDTLGHDVGDGLLQQVAECLKVHVRFSDLVARLGGDEFVLVFNGIDDDEKLLAFIEKVLNLFKQSWQVDEHVLKITCSIGVAIYPDDAKSIKELMTNADVAMYNSKGSGRNGFSFFTPQIDHKMHQEMQLTQDMPLAIKRGDFELFYQPKVDARSERVIGTEALIRWNHPERGLIQPSEFIGLAESTGFIMELGRWVIDEAGCALAYLEKLGHKDVHISINVSPRQFQNADLYSLLKQTINKYGVNPKLFHIEITERLMMEFVENNIKKLEKIKQLGVSICIDDFGKGYLSLKYLHRFSIDSLKIDRSFIDLISEREEKAILLDTIIAMAKTLKLKMMAEGVEHTYQRDYLIQKSCLQYQGFLFSRPVKLDQFVQLLEPVNSARC